MQSPAYLNNVKQQQRLQAAFLAEKELVLFENYESAKLHLRNKEGRLHPRLQQQDSSQQAQRSFLLCLISMRWHLVYCVILASPAQDSDILEQVQWRATKSVMEHMTQKQRMKMDLFDLQNWQLSGDLIAVCSHLMGGYREDGASSAQEEDESQQAQDGT